MKIELGAEHGRPSARNALPARRQQLSVKITEEACRRFRRLAVEQGVTLGDLFEQALDAWERQRSAGPGRAVR